MLARNLNVMFTEISCYAYRNILKCESSILMKLNIVLKKIFDPFSSFLSAIVDVGKVKTSLKVGAHILSNTSKIIENEIFVYIVYTDEISVF